jgi:glutamyl-tRNA synthetase
MGSARTAVFAYAYARKMGGKCILRIENTDKARSTHESLVDIMTGLEWLGLKFDEAPKMEDILVGKYDKQFFQSERADIYNSYINQLIKDGKAFINDEGVTVFKMSQEDIAVNDLILGQVIYPKDQHKDFPIRRADGSVLFHACVVIDDALSGVTHVIRANDHLANTPKHIKLYEAFGFKVPQYAHMPLILDDKGAKLSKRRTDQFVLIKDFKENGYLPETIINILGLMGWSAPDKREQFDLDYMCQNFDIKDCLKSNSRYDVKKLTSFNGEYINQMSDELFAETMIKYLSTFHSEFFEKLWAKFDNNKISQIFKIYKSRIKTLKDIVNLSAFLINDEIKYDQEAVNKHLLKDDGFGLKVLEEAGFHLSNLVWNVENIEGVLTSFAQNKLKVGVGKVMQPIRVAVTGSTISPPIGETLVLLGQDETVKRINNCIATLQAAEV